MHQLECCAGVVSERYWNVELVLGVPGIAQFNGPIVQQVQCYNAGPAMVESIVGCISWSGV